MARAVYISPNQDATTAATLGLTFLLDKTQQSAFALIQGNGTTVTLPAPVTAAQVQAVLNPILTAEAAAAALVVTANANADTLTAKATTALTANTTYLAIASPTTAQAITQVGALTKQMDALIRLVTRVLDTTAGT